MGICPGPNVARAIIRYSPMPRPSASARMTSACGAQETVTHVLVDCPNPREIRQKLRSELGRLQRRIDAGRLN